MNEPRLVDVKKNRKVPNFFIVGAAKAGTSALAKLISQHPDVYMSPLKEPHYFASDFKPEDFREDYRARTKIDFSEYLKSEPLPSRHIAFVREFEDYVELFRGAKNESVVGEASTGYLFSSNAAAEILAFNPSSKILIVLREPVSRTLSHVMMDVAGGHHSHNRILELLKGDFEANPKGYGTSNLYLDLSLYSNQVKRYLDIFPPENIMFLDYVDWASSPASVLQRVMNFLQIDEISIAVGERVNETRLPKNKLVHLAFRYKHFLPKSLRDVLRKKKRVFTTEAAADVIDDEVRRYLKSELDADWLRTMELVKGHAKHSKGVSSEESTKRKI